MTGLACLLGPLLAPWTEHPHRITELENQMAVTQADLDNIAAGLIATEGSLQQAIAKLEADIAAGNNLDLTGIRDAASGLAELVPSETGGGEGPIAPNPDSPVVDGGDTPADSGEGDGPSGVDQSDQPTS